MNARTGAAYAAIAEEQQLPPQLQVPSWLEQQQQQTSGAAAAAAGSSNSVLQQLERAPGGSMGSNGSGGSGTSTVTTGLWGQPLPNDATTGSRDSSKVSIAQEQIEGLKRLRGLKARMSVPFAWAEQQQGSGSSSGTQQGGAPGALTTLMSMDCEMHVSHCAAML
jgi:hypothetical protein